MTLWDPLYIFGDRTKIGVLSTVWKMADLLYSSDVDRYALVIKLIDWT